MDDFLKELITDLIEQHDVFLYIFLLISSIIENLFPPIPGDTITAFGAFLVGTGRLNFWFVYIVTSVGSLLGFMVLFMLGRLLGRGFFEKKNYSFFSKSSIVSAEKWFQKYGYFALLANRFIPGIRSVFSLVSGILKLKPVYVALAAFISASIWNLIYIYAGYSLGNNWDTIREKLIKIRDYNITIVITIAAIIVLFLIIRFIRKKRAASASSSVETKDGL